MVLVELLISDGVVLISWEELAELVVEGVSERAAEVVWLITLETFRMDAIGWPLDATLGQASVSKRLGLLTSIHCKSLV